MADLSYTYVVRSQDAEQRNAAAQYANSDYRIFIPQLIPAAPHDQKYKMCVKSVALASTNMELEPMIELYMQMNGSQCSMDSMNNGPTRCGAVLALKSDTYLYYDLLAAPSRIVACPNFSTLHLEWRSVPQLNGDSNPLVHGLDDVADEVPIPHHIIVLEFTPVTKTM